MTALLYEPLPTCIRADGRDIPVLTDFRAWLQFIGLVQDKTLHPEDKAALLVRWLVEPEPVTKEIAQGLVDFCRAGGLESDRPGGGEQNDPPHRPPTFDWEADARFVLADFRRFYGLDLLRLEYLHWWEFRALFLALPEESVTMHRIHIRSLDLSKVRDMERRQELARVQRQIALPFVLDDDAIAEAFDF